MYKYEINLQQKKKNLPLNNTLKDIAASRVSHIGLTMTYYVGEIFNTNKTNESTNFLENSLDKQGIPLTLEHAGLEYHCGYGNNRGRIFGTSFQFFFFCLNLHI